jgi:DNA invertase Pin-like site-specific DNA recombinase
MRRLRRRWWRLAGKRRYSVPRHYPQARQGPRIQREFLEQYCRLYRLEIVEVYADDGVSGTVPLHEKPDGRRFLEDAREDRFTAVLVSKLDRLGRAPCSSSSTLTTASPRPPVD